MNLISRIVLAIVVAIAIGLVCLLVGVVLVVIDAPIAVSIGTFFKEWAWVIGLLAGIWHFFAGSPNFWRGGPA